MFFKQKLKKGDFLVKKGAAYVVSEDFYGCRLCKVKLDISEPVITLVQKIRNGEFKRIFVGYREPTPTWELRHKNSNYKIVLERSTIMYDKRCSVRGWDFLTETEKEALEYYVIQDGITKNRLRRERVLQKWDARGRQRAFKKLSSI